jgi:hypothetical protein
VIEEVDAVAAVDALLVDVSGNPGSRSWLGVEATCAECGAKVDDCVCAVHCEVRERAAVQEMEAALLAVGDDE